MQTLTVIGSDVQVNSTLRICPKVPVNFTESMHATF